MSRIFTALALVASLAACDSANPFMATEEEDAGDAPVIDDGEEVTTEGIPTSLADDLRSVAFDPTLGTLFVDLAALDRSDTDIPLSEYTPNPGLATTEMLAQGYQVFSYQDDALDRMFVAIAAQSSDGSVVGAVVMDGGQFTKFFSGGFYATDGNYTPGNPTNDTGLVSYAGVYAGLSNLDGDGAALLPLPADTDDAIRPDQPAQIVGNIFINADFQDNTINGAIYERSFSNLSAGLTTLLGGVELDDVFLIPATITTEGTFLGTVENPAQESIGAYGGTFGGTEAAGVAGTTNLDGDWIPAIDNEIEFGVFVLTQCGQTGEDALCDAIPVNPDP
ncbi:thymidylate synthase [Octadecabacter sp. G9-8]|uniref:Thymidylate synthase n=1 Tax=Octadecabacter dasysiphoniae TaxID=2909341 RepID=A0ABS9CS82_9RHOB|nr:thymidylate synthase [Octadecabacter dasysiphoniae]MCF2870095.1 thymidylate synthase [Octadecabacter dasysiphoniae]